MRSSRPPRRRFSRLVLGLALALSSLATAAPTATAAGGADTNWMSQGKFGVMMEFLAEGCPPGCSEGSYATGQWPTPAEWNARVDNYDIPGVIDQLKSVGAGWVQVTVGQISGYWAAPNATYERLVPATESHPSRLSQRDLIRDLGLALKGTGIKLMVYAPADAPRYDTYAKTQLGGDVGDQAFEDNWVEVYRTWSNQWAGLVDGWWIDFASQTSDAYFSRLIDAMRVGNPKSLIGLSSLDWYGPTATPTSGPKTDFIAGEQAAYYGSTHPSWNPTTRFVTYPDHPNFPPIQFHALPYAQGFWGGGPDSGLRFTPQDMAARSARITSVGGAITWDVGTVRENGLMAEPSLSAMEAVGRAVGTLPASAPTSIDDADARVTYTGFGNTYGAGCYLQTCHNSNVAGSRAKVTFTGTNVTWRSIKGPDMGSADVYVDGVFKKTINLYNSYRQRGFPVYTIEGLTPGNHTLEIVAKDTKWVSVDRFVVRPDLLSIDDTSSAVTYSGFSQYNPGGCFASTCRNSNTVGSTAQVTFTGPSITWHGFRGSDQGSADVYIDGTKVESVLLSQPKRDGNVPIFSRTGLSAGAHTLKIVTTSTGWVTVDRFVTAPPVTSTIVDDASASIAYSGFSQYNPGGCWAGTCRNSNTVGSTAQVTFTGSGITWNGFRGSDMGSADVYLDGAKVASVSLVQPTREGDVPLWSTTGLTNGPHTLRIVTTSTGWVTVDRLIVASPA